MMQCAQEVFGQENVSRSVTFKISRKCLDI